MSLAPKRVRNFWNEVFLRVALDSDHQMGTFSRLRGSLSNAYATLSADAADMARLVTPFWEKTAPEIEAALLPLPPPDFLNLPSLGAMSVVHYWRLTSYYIRFLEKSFERQRLRYLLREDLPGHPILQSARYTTSSMTAQHLYHFAYHRTTTGASLDDVECVVEFGGGYGNMAKVLSRLLGRPHTHVIVDLPFIGAIQWLYLSSVLGPESVNLVSPTRGSVAPGKINIMPIPLVGKISIRPDLFIATWSLSETPPELQDLIGRVGWLQAERLLVTWHRNSKEFPDAERVRNLLPHDAKVLEMDGYYPDNYYGLR